MVMQIVTVYADPSIPIGEAIEKLWVPAPSLPHKYAILVCYFKHSESRIKGFWFDLLHAIRCIESDLYESLMNEFML